MIGSRHSLFIIRAMPGAILLGDHIFFDVFVHFSLREGPKDLTRFSFFSSEKRRIPTTIASSSRLEEKVSKKKRGRKRKRKRERESSVPHYKKTRLALLCSVKTA